MSKFFKNTLLAVLLLIFIVGSVFTAIPRANAFIGIVEDILHNITTFLQSLGDVGRWVAENAEKALRDRVVKRLIDSITNDIIYSIQNEGQPLFVQDWKRFLGVAGDIVFDDFNEILKTHGVNLCAPFGPQLQQMFAFRFGLGNAAQPLSPFIQCRFEDFKRNLEASARGEGFITRGGWTVFDQMFLPDNNIFGASLVLEDAYQKKTAEEREAKKNEAISAGGFLNQKKCIDPPGGNEENCKKWETITPGKSAGDAVAKAIGKDFEYISNVQSIVSALTNVLVSKIFDKSKGIAGVPVSRDSGVRRSSTGDLSDLEGRSGGLNTREIANQVKERMNSLRRSYVNFIDYVTSGSIQGPLGRGLSQAKVLSGLDITATSTVSTSTATFCSGKVIKFVNESDENAAILVSNALTFLFATEKQFSEGVEKARKNIEAIDNFDYEDAKVFEKASNEASKFQSFQEEYQNIFISMSELKSSSFISGSSSGVDRIAKALRRLWEGMLYRFEDGMTTYELNEQNFNTGVVDCPFLPPPPSSCPRRCFPGI